MAAKIDGEFLKKHHFWFLFVPIGIFLMLAWFGILSDVDEATSSTQLKNDAEKQKVPPVRAQPRETVTKYNTQLTDLNDISMNMWSQVWNEQKHLYVWPEGYTKEQRKNLEPLKFGSFIDNAKLSVVAQFRERNVYENEYLNLVKSVEPMQFRGDDWQKILHFVKWEKVPSPEDIWLAMEDLWVQRAFLEAISDINVKAARLDLVEPKDKSHDNPKVRQFRNRTWEIDLQIVEAKGKPKVMKGRIKNISPRLQVIGIGNAMKLKVWLAPNARDPFIFEIEGKPVKAGEVRDVEPILKPIPKHEIPDDTVVEGIFRVEQQFDARTVPIKSIQYFGIGRLSDRNNNQPLKMAAFSENLAKKEAGVTSTSMAPSNPSGGGPSGGGVALNPGGDGGQPRTEGAPAAQANLPAYSSNKLERYRYTDVTDQVRRLPIGIVILADQSYMKDILEALVNIKFRFQMTQYYWNRFHGTLNYTTGAPAPPPGGLGGLGGLGGESGSGSAPTNSRDDQFSANLLELSVLGILSLYERHPGEGKTKTPAKTTPLKP